MSNYCTYIIISLDPITSHLYPPSPEYPLIGLGLAHSMRKSIVPHAAPTPALTPPPPPKSTLPTTRPRISTFEIHLETYFMYILYYQ